MIFVARRLTIGIVLFVLALPAWAQESISPSPSRPSPSGVPAIDPTENVKALSEAANKRQDDLRHAFEESVKIKIDGLEALAKLRTESAVNERNAELRRIYSEAALRSEYEEKLRAAEKGRLDAIRAVDVAAAAEDRRRTTETATSLATQTTSLSETLRLAVVNSAAAIQLTSQQTTGALSSRITTLEQAGYQNQGKSTVQDPAFLALVQEVRSLTAARGASVGVDTGRSDVVGWIAGGIGLLLALFMAGMTMFNAMRPRQRR